MNIIAHWLIFPQLVINVCVCCLSGGHALRVHPELLEGALQLIILIPKLPAKAKVEVAVVVAAYSKDKENRSVCTSFGISPHIKRAKRVLLHRCSVFSSGKFQLNISLVYMTRQWIQKPNKKVQMSSFHWEFYWLCGFYVKTSNCIFAGILLKSYNRPDKTVNTNAIKYTQSHCNSCHFFIIVFIFYIQSSTHTIPILGL